MADNGAYAFRWLTDRGYAPHQAAAVVGNLAQESGVNPTVAPGDNGTAFGVAQWRGPRLHALQQFAQQNGQDWRSLDTQLGFLDHELHTTEKGAGDALFASPDVRSATRAVIGFERPQGYTAANPEAGHGFANRLGVAEAFLNGGQTNLPNTPLKSTTPQNGSAPYNPITSVPGQGTNDGTLASALALLAAPPSSAETDLTPLVNKAQSGPFVGEAEEPVDVSVFQPRTTRPSRRISRRS